MYKIYVLNIFLNAYVYKRLSPVTDGYFPRLFLKLKSGTNLK